MAAFLDTVMFTPTLGGTTDWVVSAAVQGYQTPALGNAVNGRVYKYRAESADLSQWEEGEGAYTVGTTTLARTTVFYNSAGTGTLQSGAGTKISFSTVPNVAVVQSKHDTISIEEANSFSGTQQAQARGNILALGVVKKQVFTASGTYTPSANLIYAIIECVGSGGAGGGVTGTAAGAFAGGGGGSGSYSRTIASAATVGVSQTVTINAGGAGVSGGTGNAGGTVSVGTICTANGGAGGGVSSGGVGAGGVGAGGTAGTGDLAARGNPGGPGFNNTAVTTNNVQMCSGNGGASHFGGGAAGLTPAGGTTAGTAAAANSGAGGSGAYTNATASSAAGGAGGSGIVFITEFCTS